jgi:alkylation response protein AidB-like acyl-CoA dehydrogenase
MTQHVIADGTSQIDQAWGSGPSARYENLAARFRPIFARIGEGAVRRELHRSLPYEEIGWLKEAGFGALRLPSSLGGADATLPELFNLLIELSAADSNITQALRSHFAFVEDVLNQRDADHRETWLRRVGAGDLVGGAWTEIGAAKQAHFSTTVTPDGDGWRVDGEKYYTTGSLFADWVDVGADDPTGRSVGAIVPRHGEGVRIVDDWDGFGQTQTASGTATFGGVRIPREHVVPDEDRFLYGAAFYQLVHLATLAGIGRAVTADVARAVAARRRTYSNGVGPKASLDPQVLQVVGRVRSAAYAAGPVVLKAAEALQRAHDARFAGADDAEAQANAVAELESAQAQTIVTDLILDAVTVAFDALGASATQKGLALDRYWRNARTLSSHNPRIYKHRIIGDFAVNGTAPPYQWRIGEA